MSSTIINKSRKTLTFLQTHMVSFATLCPISKNSSPVDKISKITFLLTLVLGADPETLTAQPKASHITPGKFLSILVTLRILCTSSCEFHDLIHNIFLICR